MNAGFHDRCVACGGEVSCESDCPSLSRSYTVKEETLRDLSRFANPEVTFKGGEVIVKLEQEMFDPIGAHIGTGQVAFKGTRNFGRTVTFRTPVVTTLVQVIGPDNGSFAELTEDRSRYLVEMAQFALEAIADIEREKP